MFQVYASLELQLQEEWEITPALTSLAPIKRMTGWGSPVLLTLLTTMEILWPPRHLFLIDFLDFPVGRGLVSVIIGKRCVTCTDKCGVTEGIMYLLKEMNSQAFALTG